MLFSRREFLGGLAAAGALSALPQASFAMNLDNAVLASCPFRLSVIDDEIFAGFRPRMLGRRQRFWPALDRAAQHVEQKRQPISTPTSSPKPIAS